MDSPITTECEALRAEVVLLEDETRRLLNEIMELRKTPAYPEAAVQAVWEHGYRAGVCDGHNDTVGTIPDECLYYADIIARIFTEKLKNGVV